jgi:thioredoxin-like negative regulator of GroEL
MRIPNASAWLVGFGVVASAAWVQEAVTQPVVADAAACSAEIARLEMVLSQAQSDRQVAASAPESVAARLHHQPTPETVGKATAEAEENVEAAFAAARKLESEGKDTECVATLAKVAVPLGMH